MNFDRLLNAGFILGATYLLGKKIEKEKTWRQVVKFFPGDEGEQRLYNSTPEFLYGLFLSTAFVNASQEEFTLVDSDELPNEVSATTGLYL